MTDQVTTRDDLTPVQRLNIDTLAAVGGKGHLVEATGHVYTLHLPADPSAPQSPAAPSGRVPVHNVSRPTLDKLHQAGLVDYPDGFSEVRLTDRGRELADADRRRAELAGIADVGACKA